MGGQSIEAKIGNVSKSPNDCQERIQIPDQSFLSEERGFIVRIADLRYQLILFSEDLVFLQHGQSEKERHL
jgi:hypothetical protein